MRKIKLAHGLVALVDDRDYECVAGYHWWLIYRRGTWAARATIAGKGVLMHRFILDAPAGMMVDHVNHNTLDNRRANLRLCTNRQNHQNTPKYRGRSRYKGVQPFRGKWRAMITVDGKSRHLGLCATEEEAARLYNAAARAHFGEFACLNDIDQ